MTYSDLLFKFKEHLKALNRSESTIDHYYNNLCHFLSVLPETDMKKVNRAMIEAYIVDLYQHRTYKGTRYSTGTICIKVRSVKRFFEFLEKANIIFIDPSEFIKEPPKDKRLPKKILTRQETLRVLDQPDLNTPTGIRDRAILETFDSTGIRLNEICCLSIYDADLTGKMLRINNGKGRKDRVVPLGRHAVRFLKEYIARVRPHYTEKKRSEKSLFIDKHGNPIKKQTVSVMVKRYGRKADLNRPVSPHMFRHGFATELIKNGADLLSVQKMMGHADARTTQVYIRSLGQSMKKVHQKTHPREKDNVDPKTIDPTIERMMPANDTEKPERNGK